MKRLPLLFLALAACQPSGPTQIEVRLDSQSPSEGRRVGWSPRGEQLTLDDSSRTTITLGENSFDIRLARSEGAPYFDELWLDGDLSGTFEADEMVRTEPSETRGKIWSSFDTEILVPSIMPSGDPGQIPYPIAFWYVEDPLEPDAPSILRYSRRGWTQGSLELDGVPALIMLTESMMDGVLDEQDSWALAEADSESVLLGYKATRAANRHAWLGERAYRLISIHPSGLSATLQAGDPGITRAEEAEQEDVLAVDRRAPRSGRSVNFIDFEEAEALARTSGKPLFVDFKTVWCGPCYTMDEWVFTADAVVEASSEVISTKVDGDDRRDLAARFEVEAYPTVLLVSPEGEVLRRHVGYLGVDSTAAFLTGPG